MVDRLRQLSVQHVRGVNFGAAAALPDAPELRAQLTVCEYVRMAG